MFPALLAAGLPALVKLVGSALGAVDNPIAKAAGAALGDVASEIGAGRITPEQIAEANRHVETMAQIDADLVTSTNGETNATYRAEISSADAYVRRMRPTWGYGLLLAFVAVMGAIAYVVVTNPAQAPALLSALADTWFIWGSGFAVIGVYVRGRTKEKLSTNTN